MFKSILFHCFAGHLDCNQKIFMSILQPSRQEQSPFPSFLTHYVLPFHKGHYYNIAVLRFFPFFHFNFNIRVCTRSSHQMLLLCPLCIHQKTNRSEEVEWIKMSKTKTLLTNMSDQSNRYCALTKSPTFYCHGLLRVLTSHLTFTSCLESLKISFF